MIRVVRTARPGILRKNGRQWTLNLLAATTKADKATAEKKYNNKEISHALETMFHGKCAYCESKIKHVAYAHIEHYRPKKAFPQHAFVWHNLLHIGPGWFEWNRHGRNTEYRKSSY